MNAKSTYTRLFTTYIQFYVTVHSVPVTGQNPCKIASQMDFDLTIYTFSHGMRSSAHS